jgi:hypothetical protein
LQKFTIDIIFEYAILKLTLTIVKSITSSLGESQGVGASFSEQSEGMVSASIRRR